MIITRDEAFRFVCAFYTPVGDGKFDVGTGMFISSPAGQDLFYGWIVTASHVAKATTESTLVAIATEEGRALVLPIDTFGNVNWRHHNVADISAMQITITTENEKLMNNRFFPFDHIFTGKTPVSRDYELTSIGFPAGLGVSGSFSPLSFRSYASSGFITYERSDTHTQQDFFCLEAPGVGGYSGCPVFDLGYSTNGLVTMTKEKTWCYGFMHGTLSDETGGKIAFVTPAFYLPDIIDVR